MNTFDLLHAYATEHGLDDIPEDAIDLVSRCNQIECECYTMAKKLVDREVQLNAIASTFQSTLPKHRDDIAECLEIKND